MAHELPVLDMAGFISDPTSVEGARFVSDLLAAAHGPGFVYLTGHGIDPSRDAELFDVARAFFALPVREREAIAIEHSAAFRGYTVLGDERTNGTADWRHQLELGLEQDVPDLTKPHPPWMRMRGPNQWPTSLPRMSTAVLGWMEAMNAVGLAALRALALGLGQPIELAAVAPGLSSVIDPDFSTQFGENNLKTRLRSHPDVAKRHYADLM